MMRMFCLYSTITGSSIVKALTTKMFLNIRIIKKKNSSGRPRVTTCPNSSHGVIFVTMGTLLFIDIDLRIRFLKYIVKKC